MKFTDQESALLREIQRDCSTPLAKLSQRLGMASSTIWRKVNDLEAAGVIRARVALLDPTKVGVKLCLLASVSLDDHSEEAVAAFASLVNSHPEIQECHAVSGNADYIIKVRVADVEAYEAFMTHNLLRNPHVRAVVSSFVLKEIKSSTEVPV